MHIERWAAFVAAVALAAGCGSGGKTVGTSSVPDPGAPVVDGGGSGGGGSPGGGGGGGDGGATTGAPDGGAAPDGGGPTVTPCSTMPEIIGAYFAPAAADDRYVYGWGDRQIARIPLGGGAAETVVGNIDVTSDWSLTVDDRQLYWIWQDWRAPQPRTVLLRAPKSGGVASVVSDQHGGLNVVADRDALYFVVASPNQPPALMRAPKDGGAPTLLSHQANGVDAVDGKFAYWIAPTSPDSGMLLVRRAPLDGGPAETIGSWRRYGDVGVDRSASDGRAIYALDFGRVVRADLATGVVTTLYDPQAPGAIPAGDRPGAFTLDDDSIYWATNRDFDPPPTYPIHFVDRVGKDGSAATVLESSFHGGGHSVVAAGDSVYYDEGTTTYRRCRR